MAIQGFIYRKFIIPKNSPAVGKGGAVKELLDDYSGNSTLHVDPLELMKGIENIRF